MIAKWIGRGANGSRKKEARKARALIDYAIDLTNYDATALGLGRLLGYLTKEAPDPTGVKCAGWGTRNFASSQIEDIQAEMMSLATVGRNRKSAICHIVLSWQEGERPTHQQIEEAISTVMEVLNGSDLQAVWGHHSNTSNDHVHLVINRIRPSDFSVCELADGWLVDGLHQSVALIEARQGWASEPRAIYVATANGEIRERASGLLVRSASGDQVRPNESRAVTRDTGIFKGLVEELELCRSWLDIHHCLKRRKLRYKPKGSGAVIAIIGANTEIKLSHAISKISHAKLAANFGPFEGDGTPEARVENEFTAFRRRLRLAQQSVSEHRKRTWSLLEDSNRHIRLLLPRGLDRDLSAAIDAAIRQEYAEARRHLAQEYDQVFARFKGVNMSNLAHWKAAGCPDIPVFTLPTLMVPAQPYEARVDGPIGYDRSTALFNVYSHQDKPTQAIIDLRCMIVVSGDDETMLAGMQMACRRWGKVEIVADSPETTAVLERLAKAHQLDVNLKPPAEFKNDVNENDAALESGVSEHRPVATEALPSSNAHSQFSISTRNGDPDTSAKNYQRSVHPTVRHGAENTVLSAPPAPADASQASKLQSLKPPHTGQTAMPLRVSDVPIQSNQRSDDQRSQPPSSKTITNEDHPAEPKIAPPSAQSILRTPAEVKFDRSVIESLGKAIRVAKINPIKIERDENGTPKKPDISRPMALDEAFIRTLSPKQQAAAQQISILKAVQRSCAIWTIRNFKTFLNDDGRKRGLDLFHRSDEARALDASESSGAPSQPSFTRGPNPERDGWER